VPAVVKQGPLRARPVPQRLSYSQISDYGKCGYRFYLRRVLGLPNVEPPPPDPDYETPSLDPRVRGTIVHRLLEELDFKDPQPPEIHDEELTPEQVDDIRRLVAAFATSPLCNRLANARQVTREAGFQFTLEPDGSGPLVRGLVDVLAVEPDGTHLVVDYKTDRIDADPDEYVKRNYEVQRLVYALAALRDGAPRVEVAYCMLDHAPDQPITVVYSQQDAPDLADEINRLARGILTHDYPVAETPHRELCGECPGRTALCSYSEEETLRPPPALWPGAPARRRPPADVAPVGGPPLR
jgi:RecB family exonuclease